MKDINSKVIHSSIKGLLSYATSKENVNRSYEEYLKLYGLERGGTFVGCIGIKFFNSNQDAVDFYRRLGFNITSLGEKYPNAKRLWGSFDVNKRDRT